MRVQNIISACYDPLGMESGEIKASQLGSSSTYVNLLQEWNSPYNAALGAVHKGADLAGSVNV